jgi:uncharacterized protein YjeT (DUF2065 family)
MADDLVLAVALLLVIEGALYALFPDGMKRVLARMVLMPTGSLRSAGLVSAVAGVGIVWLVRH